MFHKNSKAISSLKFRLGVSQLWYTGSYSNKKIFNHYYLYHFFVVRLLIEHFINNLSKMSQRTFRFNLKKKKRKIFWLLKYLTSFSAIRLKKIFVFYKKLQYKTHRRQLLLKKFRQFKYRAKQLRLSKQGSSIFYNSKSSDIIIGSTSVFRFVAVVPLTLLYRAGYLSTNRFKFWRRGFRVRRKSRFSKTKQLVFSKSKVMLLKLKLLRRLLEKFIFANLSINVTLLFLDSAFSRKSRKNATKKLKALTFPRRWKYNSYYDFVYRKLIYIAYTAFLYASPVLLGAQIAERITKIRKHRIALKHIRKALFYTMGFNPEIVGVQVLVCGKLNGRPRTKTSTIYLGKRLSMASLKNTIYYSFHEATSYTGTFGVHVWFLRH